MSKRPLILVTNDDGITAPGIRSLIEVMKGERIPGEFINEDSGEDTDEAALARGYISIVPTQFDLTAHHAIQKLNTWNFEE